MLDKNLFGGEQIVALYETLFVVHPEKSPRIKEFIEKFRKVIEGQNGSVAHVDEWGLRDLAYRIEKQAKGFYALIQYQSSGAAVEELERNLRLTDGVLRYLTVRADEGEAAPEARKSQPEEPKTVSEPGTEKTDSQS
jgi:small subunit ribosomal protein S6